MLKSFLKKLLPQSHIRILAKLNNKQTLLRYRLLCFIRKKFFLNALLSRKAKLHVGCGDITLKKFLNVDCRPTAAADIIHDCVNISCLPDNHFSRIYSHAFFEHLFPNQRVICLKDMYRLLSGKGAVIFVGIPDFEIVARAYLEKEKGILSDIFDLYHVQRYTHDPVISDCMDIHADGFLEQIHKSLFDKNEMKKLLERAGFQYFCIFNYCFHNEHIPLNIGFVAFRQKPESFSLDMFKKEISQLNPNLTVDSFDIFFENVFEPVSGEM